MTRVGVKSNVVCFASVKRLAVMFVSQITYHVSSATLNRTQLNWNLPVSIDSSSYQQDRNAEIRWKQFYLRRSERENGSQIWRWQSQETVVIVDATRPETPRIRTTRRAAVTSERQAWRRPEE